MSFFSKVNLKRGFPKWDGLIDLAEAGISVPHAAFSEPNSNAKGIRDLVVHFLNEMKTDLLALRPDGGTGVGKTPSGINLKKEDIDKIIQQVVAWNSQHLGVVLIDTHNRFDYDFCCNCLLDDDGSFHLEFVGPGFDGGDLNKAILLPTTIVQSKFTTSIFYYSDPVSSEPNLDSLEHLFFRVDIERRSPTEEEIDTRLKYIATQLLPDMRMETNRSKKSAIAWLKANNYNKLFDYERSKNYVSENDLKEIILAASRYANQLKRNGQKLQGCVLTAHKYDNKIVFFGTFNGKKWGK